MEPAEAAEAAAEATKDNTSISDIIRVPFGYLLDWLYNFSRNYGVALLLFSLIVKLVLFPLSVKSKKSMLKMSRLAPLTKALEAKYGDDKQKYQQAVQQLAVPKHVRIDRESGLLREEVHAPRGLFLGGNGVNEHVPKGVQTH